MKKPECERLIEHHRQLLESRENTHLRAFLDRFGPEAEGLISKSYYEHGLASGKKALRAHRGASRDVKTAVELELDWCAKGLSHITHVEWLELNEMKAVARSKGCIHLSAWKAAGIPLVKGCDLYSAWVTGFVQAVNPGIVHYKVSRVSAGDDYCEEVWELSSQADSSKV